MKIDNTTIGNPYTWLTPYDTPRGFIRPKKLIESRAEMFVTQRLFDPIEEFLAGRPIAVGVSPSIYNEITDFNELRTLHNAKDVFEIMNRLEREHGAISAYKDQMAALQAANNSQPSAPTEPSESNND